jgi:hypothetical protein
MNPAQVEADEGISEGIQAFTLRLASSMLGVGLLFGSRLFDWIQ